MTTTVMKLITADELLAMPRGYGYRYELIRGAVIPSPASVEPVAAAITYAAYQLSSYADAYGTRFPITLAQDDILDLGDLLPGFSTPVWRLFRRQPPSP